MATGVQVWSETPATNATADSAINWQEGQAPSTVNNSARGMMAATAAWRDDNSGSLLTSGSSTAFTLVTNQVEGALTAGYTVTAQFHAVAESSATLNVDSLGPKPITLYSTTQLAGQEIQAGSVQHLTYTTSGTGQWQLQDYTKPIISYFTSTGLSSSVTLTATANYYDGPSVAQGTTGIWYVSGTVTFSDSGTGGRCFGKLWDGTTVISAGAIHLDSGGVPISLTLSGAIVNPAGNLRISGKSNQVATSIMQPFNGDLLQGASLTAVRIG